MRYVLCDPEGRFAVELAELLTARGEYVAVVSSPARLPGPARFVMDLTVAAAFLRRTSGPAVPVLALTDRRDRDVVREAVMLGVSGLMSARAGAAAVLAGLDRMSTDGQYFAADLLRTSLACDRDPSDAELVLRRLTPRERDVLAAIVAGHSTRVMARELGITPATVRSHVQRVLAKLEVHSRVAAARFVLAHGLEETSEPTQEAD